MSGGVSINPDGMLIESVPFLERILALYKDGEPSDLGQRPSRQQFLENAVEHYAIWLLDLRKQPEHMEWFGETEDTLYQLADAMYPDGGIAFFPNRLTSRLHAEVNSAEFWL